MRLNNISPHVAKQIQRVFLFLLLNSVQCFTFKFKLILKVTKIEVEDKESRSQESTSLSSMQYLLDN